MAEAKKTAKAEALKNKAKLQQRQAQAFAKAQRIKHMMSKPKPRIKAPPS
ncbi:MAG: hypothetical protein HQL52_19110 [Magnetococcales bacterium]|nr:hypothetical protein [Magnetococcales bacterium]